MNNYIDWDFEELGKNMGKLIHARIYFDVQPEEKKTWDYPGCPAYSEITSVECLYWENDTNESIAAYDETEQKLLDKIAEKLAHENWDDIFLSWAEEQAEREYPC